MEVYKLSYKYIIAFSSIIVMVKNQLQRTFQNSLSAFLDNTGLKILFVDGKHDILPKFMIHSQSEWSWATVMAISRVRAFLNTNQQGVN